MGAAAGFEFDALGADLGSGGRDDGGLVGGGAACCGCGIGFAACSSSASTCARSVAVGVPDSASGATSADAGTAPNHAIRIVATPAPSSLFRGSSQMRV